MFDRKINVMRISMAVVVLVLLFAITACAGSQAPATGGTEASPEMEASPESEASPEESPEASPEVSPEASPEESPEASPEAPVEPIDEANLVVYSGRNEQLVGPLIERFEEEMGIEVSVRYGETAQMAALILEEGPNSPADVYFAQDAGALGALADAGRLQELPEELLSLVPQRFRADNGTWVGASGRARVVVYNTEQLSEEELPDDIFGFTDPAWQGRIGWAPTNGSFQAFVTALRVVEGEDRAREWLEGIQANEPKVYANNIAVLEAVASGEVDAGFVNHYYLFRKLAEEGETFPARNHFFPDQNVGNLVNVAGVGILNTTDQQEAAEAFVQFLLSPEAQNYFSSETKEYPLVEGVEADPLLPMLNEIQIPDLDLSDLDDLEGTLELLQELGIL
ncbi:MAG: extracellular solute-binding protein [Ardenticatenaceae bacterium]